MKRPDGAMLLIEDVPSIEALTNHGARVVNTNEPQLLLDGTAYVSGEIPRVTPFETGLPGQHRLALDGKSWELDELIMDERFVAVNVRGKGLVVFTACSHAGVVNVLTSAQSFLPEHAPLRRPRRIASLGNERTDHPADGRGHAGLRPLRDRSRPLHRLARDDRACQCVRRFELAPLAVGKRFTF